MGSNRATWVGPGTVVTPDGANLWVSMLGELWRVAREQCRPATTLEQAGVEAVMGECQELVEQFKRNVHRAGYRDITNEDFPAMDGEEEADGGDSPQEDEASKRARIEVVEPALDGVEQPAVPEQPDEAIGPSSNHSIDEPEVEGTPSLPNTISYSPTTPISSINGENPVNALDDEEGNPTVEHQVNLADPTVRRALQESIRRSDQLDGYHPHRQTRWHTSQNPYLGESETWMCHLEDEEVIEKEEYEKKMDVIFDRRTSSGNSWLVKKETKKLIKFHDNQRRSRYNPAGSQDIPIPTWALHGGSPEDSRHEGEPNREGEGGQLASERWQPRSKLVGWHHGV